MCFIERLNKYWDRSVDYIRVRLNLVMENGFDILLMCVLYVCVCVCLYAELVLSVEMWVSHFIDL